MVKTVEFTHTRTPSSAHRLAITLAGHRTEKDLSAEKFAGHIIITGYATVVNLFDGEQEHYFISSSMQSGDTEIVMARADVDGGVTSKRYNIRTTSFSIHFRYWMSNFPQEVAEYMRTLLPEWDKA